MVFRAADHVVSLTEVRCQRAYTARVQGFVELCGRLGIECHVLVRRATENYFTDRAVKEVFGKGHAALEHYENLSSHRPGWPKSKNWRIARKMELDELRDTDLGEFLEKL